MAQGTVTAGAQEGSARARRPRALRPRRREALWAYAFIAPVLVVFGAFMFLPLAWTFLVSVQQKPLFGPPEFVGLDNFREPWTDDTFRRSVVNTVGYAVITVPLSMGLGLGLALLLNRACGCAACSARCSTCPSSSRAWPAASSPRGCSTSRSGWSTSCSGDIGLGPYHWQSNQYLAIVTIVLVTLWQSVGFGMIIFLAALQGVDRELYDAAAVDGSSPWQRFRFVTLPSIRNTTVFLAIVGVISSFQVFDIVYVTTGGGPGDTTNVLGLYAYQTAFQTRDQGLGAAIGVVLFGFILAVTLVQLRVSARARRRAR